MQLFVGWSALHAAAFLGYADLCRILLRDGGAEPDGMCDGSKLEVTTPLQLAVSAPLCRSATVRVLLEYGADVSSTCAVAILFPLGMPFPQFALI